MLVSNVYGSKLKVMGDVNGIVKREEPVAKPEHIRKSKKTPKKKQYCSKCGKKFPAPGKLKAHLCVMNGRAKLRR